MKSRRGITLVELMVAVVVATTVLGVLTAAVSRLMAANRRSHDHLQTVVALGRLGEQFRKDVHAAHAAVVEPSQDEPARLALEGPENRTVEYTITPEGLTRVVQVDGEPQARDRFVLPTMKLLGWQADDEHREISLRIGRLARPDTLDTALAGQFSITAALAGPDAPSPAP